MGLRPKRRDSGERSPQLSITKSGDRLLRRLLVQCSQYILGYHGEDSDLRRWGLGLAARGGPSAKRKAIARSFHRRSMPSWQIEFPIAGHGRARAALQGAVMGRNTLRAGVTLG